MQEFKLEQHFSLPDMMFCAARFDLLRGRFRKCLISNQIRYGEKLAQANWQTRRV